MRILANENFPRDAVEALQARGHDVAWVRADAPGKLSAAECAELWRGWKWQRAVKGTKQIGRSIGWASSA